jgi:hypothetical protein
MIYKRLDDREIEIIPEQIPIDHVLEYLAKILYESADPPRSEFLKLLDRESEIVDFRAFVIRCQSACLPFGVVIRTNRWDSVPATHLHASHSQES